MARVLGEGIRVGALAGTDHLDAVVQFHNVAQLAREMRSLALGPEGELEGLRTGKAEEQKSARWRRGSPGSRARGRHQKSGLGGEHTR